MSTYEAIPNGLTVAWEEASIANDVKKLAEIECLAAQRWYSQQPYVQRDNICLPTYYDRGMRLAKARAYLAGRIKLGQLLPK